MIRRIACALFGLLAFCGTASAQSFPGYAGSGQIQIGQGNSALPLWLALSADCTLTLSGAITCLKTNGVSFGTMATQNANAVAITGGTITGLGNPTNPSDASNKAYVDSVAVGLVVHTQVKYTTVAPLAANTYNNGTAGVGATLTGNSNGAVVFDGVTPSSSDRVLVKNEAAPANNGIYTVSTVGSGGAPYVLTRATDANTAGTGDINKIGLGSFVFVQAGNTQLFSGWIVNSTVTTIGTSAINWTQFSGGGGIASLNALTGALTINSGSSISVISGGSTITLALSNNRLTNPTFQKFLSGAGTYITPATALWIEITIVGAGGGGAGGNAAGNGTTGGATCWNTSGAACTTPVYSAGGGVGGSNSGVGGGGGAVTGSSPCDWSAGGGGGGAGLQSNASGSTFGSGGVGGSSSLGGGGQGVITGTNGVAGAANTGGGGSGGGVGNANTRSGGGGGGAGATCHVLITGPAGTYTYAVGAGGAGSAGGGAGGNGGAGAAGMIIVYEHYGS